MNFRHPESRLFVPDDLAFERALQRCTHMGIGAHQDDLEIMAFHGVLECFDNKEQWFCGVTCTDGTGGPRKNGLEHLAAGEIGVLRNQEQDKAARLGQYGAMVQLNLCSEDVKARDKSGLIANLHELLLAVQPGIVYTHNPADKHDSHVGVVVATLEAIRMMPAGQRPEKLYGCEVWRDLDWLDDDEKVRLDVSGHDKLAMSLISCHDSQITPAKRYDLATMGRRRANATFSDSHANTPGTSVIHAMELSALLLDDALSLKDFLKQRIGGFEQSVMVTLADQLRR